MPKGIPVATVAVDNGFNAGLLAVRILALSDKKLGKWLKKFKEFQKLKVKKANHRLKR
jgi:5-(carboxyamino)imidazole ribonucleotide mutase